MGAIFHKKAKEKLPEVPKSFWEISAKDIDGNLVPMSNFKDKKAILCVNVASSWGLTTKQYKGLNKLYTDNKDQGLEILGFPCNQFMGQENKCETDIKEFAKAMKVKFPMFSKLNVNGKDAHPLYIYLRANSKLFDAKGKTIQEIPWNFAKFLVDRNGKVTGLYNPDVAAESLDKDIKNLLV